MKLPFDQRLLWQSRKSWKLRDLFKYLVARPWLFARLAMVSFMFLGGSTFLVLKFTHQLSPGPLSTYQNNGPLGGVHSHAELSTQCSHCHAPIHCVTDSRCQDCHIEIARDRDDINTLHGRLPGVSRCQTCHPEHQGETADLTELAFNYVDHYLLAGFSLDQHAEDYAGAELDCESCHDQHGNIADTLDCTTCHAAQDHDYTAQHIETYGTACAECHDGRDRMLTGFDHAAHFPLNGQHAETDCAGCHTEQHYAGQPSGCSDCHAEPDVHMAQFGTDCESCHSEVAWTPAELKRHDFKLACGDKAIEDCKACHTDTYTEYTCVSCHEDKDIQSTHAQIEHGLDQDCASCHLAGMDKQNVRAPGLGDGGQNGVPQTPVQRDESEQPEQPAAGQDSGNSSAQPALNERPFSLPGVDNQSQSKKEGLE